jgi:hypothetical protein
MVGVMVCGSRTITDVPWIEHQIEEYLKFVYKDQEAKYGTGDRDFVIIQGLARGVDKIAKDWADKHKVLTWDFPAEWDKYGAWAGFKRNIEMVDKCDYCLILWDGQSRGTKHDIILCQSKNKPHKIIVYNNPRKII